MSELNGCKDHKITFKDRMSKNMFEDNTDPTMDAIGKKKWYIYEFGF